MVGINVIGSHTFLGDIIKVTNEITQAMDDVGELFVEQIRSNIAANGNILTGAMYDSVRYEPTGSSQISIIIDSKNPKDGVAYASYVEEGTSHSQAFFNVQDAQAIIEPQIANMIDDKISNILGGF
ncbi:hypothetical protein P70_0016 [Listeria phage P70]|nr:hypothetical protein P70_0016 [Listeria phage P70]AFQ96205.1 hypothetical protein P70_0016 [Listeria phage P70]